MLPFIVIIQVVLGVFTVLYSPDRKLLLWLGVSHQFVAMILLLSILFQYYLLKSNNRPIAG
jgi:heme a synthase